MERIHYFAYGSNMSVARLQQRVPSAIFVCVASLADHGLSFDKVSKDGSGKCTIFPSQRECVLGGVFEIDIVDVLTLDRLEGLDFGYQKDEYTVLSDRGALDVFSYFATSRDASLRPYSWYKEHVVRGAREIGLPAEYTVTIESVGAEVDPDGQRARKELRIYG